MKSILKFLILILILCVATVLVIPLIVMIVEAADDTEESFLFKMYKEI